MRFILVALLVGISAVFAVVVHHDTGSHSQRQEDIWRLFKHINQPSYYKDHVEIAHNYHFWEHVEAYKKPEYVEEFYNYWHYGKLLHRGEIFSIFHEEHLKHAVALFKLFYYAKDYEIFYKTAVWARNHVNEGTFLYSFSVALVHRPDTYYFSLPPIHEVYPHYFYNSEVIQKAQNYKQMYNGHDEHYNHKTIYANYSGWYLNVHHEQALSYFTEDVGINSYYYYYNLYYPFWMNGEEFNLKYDNRGEVFYYMYQQILARYYLERLSNGYGEIDHFDWEVPFETGYYSSLCYPNGLHFPERPHHAHLHEYFYNYGQKYGYNKYTHSYTYVHDYERRIRDVIDSGYVFSKSGQKIPLFSHEGINILGNLIEGNPDSPYYTYYGTYQVFARHLLGYSHQPLSYHKLHPSALEHFETSLRDPAFYQLYKKLISYFYRYKHQHYHYYTKHDLAYHGVEVKNVEFDHLVTYFDQFYADLSNAVYVTPEEFVDDTFKVQVAQERLNHKPFTYKIHVNSDKETEAVVKVFLGPKYDEHGRFINLTENWMNFVQFDHFVYKLTPGENVIHRDSHEIYNYIHDRTSYYQMYQKAMGVHEQDYQSYYHHDQFWYGFPQRYMLPKGSHDGTTYQFYVFISNSLPYKHHSNIPIVGSGSQYVDAYPMGYPLDRPVYYEQLFYDLPNSYFHEVKIYHEGHHYGEHHVEEHHHDDHHYEEQHHDDHHYEEHHQDEKHHPEEHVQEGYYYVQHHY